MPWKRSEKSFDLKYDLSEFEKTIGYIFKDRSLLELSLTHPSWSGEAKKTRIESNQRLEFLGDAVLELAVSDYLYRSHPDIEEGELTKLRSSLVFERALSLCAQSISLGDYIRLGRGEDACGGREKPSILSDAFEAVIGAVYLDGGNTAAVRFIQDHVISCVDEAILLKDNKSRLQELIQKREGFSIRYETEEGADEEFTARLYINNEWKATGKGRSKKIAEQEAAAECLKAFGQ